MAALDFGDDMALRRLDNTPSTFTRRFAEDSPKPQPIDWPIEDDLAFRAHAQLTAHVGHPLPIDCTITKRIPAGAGLGGGSSNAAGMLVGLRKLFALSASDQDLLTIAQALGADVTFQTHAILGQPAAFVSGIGEAIEPINTIPAFHCVLAFPDGTCPTAAVYHAFDQAQEGSSEPFSKERFQAWASASAIPPPHNDLCDAAIHVCPAITPALQIITTQGIEPRITGSGSALFAIVESKHHGIAIAEALKQDGLAAHPASFSPLPRLV